MLRKKAWIVLALAACAGTAAFAGGAKEAPASKDAPAMKPAPIVMKFGVDDNTTSIEYKVAVKMNDVLADLSGGSMKFEIFPGGTLGNAKEMVNQITLGELDAYMEPLGGLNQQIPQLSVLEMAYVVKDLDHLKRVLNSDIGKGIQKQLIDDYKIRVLDMTLFGTRQTSSNRPLRSIADYKGLRLRVPASRGLKDFAEAMGARPTSIAFAEVYLALKTNSVDGEENPLPTINSMKFYEAQKAISMDYHVVQDKSILFSDIRWNKLNAQQQSWLTQAAAAASAESVRLVNEQSESLLKFFKDQGLEITYPDVAPMRAAMKPYYEKFEKELNIVGLIEKIQNM